MFIYSQDIIGVLLLLYYIGCKRYTDIVEYYYICTADENILYIKYTGWIWYVFSGYY